MQCPGPGVARPIVRRYDAAPSPGRLRLPPSNGRHDGMKRKHLSLAIGCVLMLPAAAWAQDATAAAESTEAISPAQAAQQAAETRTLGAVEVTARRRSESIQDVPVAVTAFGEDQLKDLQAGDIGGLQGAVPNLNIVQGRGSANSVNVFIRGIGQPDALQTFDPGVGMYVDDVYYSRINGALFSLFDIAQVEVLRGPQGTLYGKNSTGGAIKLTTKDPFDYSGGSVELLAGDYGRAQASFYLSSRLNDSVAASVAGTSSHNGGYVTDPVTGKHYNGDDTEAVRAKLAFRNGEDFSATLTLDHTRQDAALTLGRPTADLQASDLAGLPPPVLLPAPTGEYDFQTRTSFGPDHGQEMTHSGLALNVDWAINDAWLFRASPPRPSLPPSPTSASTPPRTSPATCTSRSTSASSARNCSCSTTTAATSAPSSARTTSTRRCRPTRRPTPTTSCSSSACRSTSCAPSRTTCAPPAPPSSPTRTGSSPRPGPCRPACAIRATPRITTAPRARSSVRRSRLPAPIRRRSSPARTRPGPRPRRRSA